MDIHLIPGLGADHRIFQRLLVDAPHRFAYDHPRMAMGSSLHHFAAALAERIDSRRPHVLIGMSMGGMIAQELALMTRPRGTFLISTWKGPQEMPLPIRSLRGTHPERLVNKALLRRIMPMVRWQMGVQGEEETALLDHLLKDATIEQLKVQVAAVLAWEGPSKPVTDMVHIHGDSDRLMPLSLIRDAEVVRGGTHFMVYSRAAAVEAILLRHWPGNEA